MAFIAQPLHQARLPVACKGCIRKSAVHRPAWCHTTILRRSTRVSAAAVDGIKSDQATADRVLTILDRECKANHRDSLDYVPGQLQPVLDELKAVPPEQRASLTLQAIAGVWEGRLADFGTVSDGRVTLGTMTFNSWAPHDMQLDVRDVPNGPGVVYMGRLPDGTSKEDHYQIDAAFRVLDGPLKGQLGLHSIIGRMGVADDHPARQQIWFESIRLQPLHADQAARQQWVEFFLPQNTEVMDDQGVANKAFPQAIPGFRDWLCMTPDFHVAAGNRGGTTIMTRRA